MDKIDRLMRKVRPSITIDDRLRKDNPFLGKTDAELFDYITPTSESYRGGLDPSTWEGQQFVYALMHAPHESSELDLENEWIE